MTQVNSNFVSAPEKVANSGRGWLKAYGLRSNLTGDRVEIRGLKKDGEPCAAPFAHLTKQGIDDLIRHLEAAKSLLP